MSYRQRSYRKMRMPERPPAWGLDLLHYLDDDYEGPPPAGPTPLPIDAPVFPADSPSVVPTVTPANLNCGWERTAAGALKKTPPLCAMDRSAAGVRPTRSVSDITHVVIHTMDGHFDHAVNAWATSTAGQECCKPHYAVKSDGTATQVVPERLIAIHGNGANAFSVGIEHDGFSSDPNQYTDALYRTSAKLTRDICLRHGIPMNRKRIIGHDEALGTTHGDPGGYWDWDYYMALVRWDGTPASSPNRIVVDTTSLFFVTTGTGWTAVPIPRNANGPGPIHAYSPSIQQTTPTPTFTDGAMFFMWVPTDGIYEAAAWWPVRPGQNPETGISIDAGQTFINVTRRLEVWVNQTSAAERSRPTLALPNTPMWYVLGELKLAANDIVTVTVWRGSRKPGKIVADAVRLLKRC